MGTELTRRQFVKGSLLSSTAAAALTGSALSAAEGRLPSSPGTAPGLAQGKIKDLQISRLLLGGNLLTHFTHSRDLRYVYELARHYNTKQKVLETFALAEANGINTVVLQGIIPTWKEYRQKLGGKIQCIYGPVAPVDDGLAQYNRAVQEVVDAGVDAVYFWGVHADRLVAENKIGIIAKAVEIAKSYGVPSGVAAHQLEVIAACEKHQVPADFYIKTLHHHNYPSAKLNFDSMWCTNPEETIKLMKAVQKPWIAFKVMAAGAIPPRDAFRYAFVGGADFILAGMFDFEIAEDVQITKEILRSIAERERPWRA